MNRVCTLPTFDSRSWASRVSVISSLALAMISPVSALTTLCARLAQLGHHRLGDLVVGVGDDLAGIRRDHVVRQRAAEDEVVRRLDALDAGGLHVADVLHRDALVLGDDGLAGLVLDVEARHFAAQALGHHLEQDMVLLDVEGVEREEFLEDALGRVAQRLQQDGDRHLAAPVDAEEHDVLRVELEVEPRAAVRNHARARRAVFRRSASCRGRARRTRRASGAAG